MENVAKPLGDRVLVIPTQGEEKSKSGIVMTETVMRGQAVWGEVVSVGDGIFTQTGERIPMTIEVGDKVMYKKDMTGDPIKLDGKQYLIFREHDLIMVIKNK
jgi:chaperonin GroES